MKINYSAVSNVGAVRSVNEDMALIFGLALRDDETSSMVNVDKETRFAAVIADGMGGYEGGEVASEMAVKGFDDFLMNLDVETDPLEVMMAVKQWFDRENIMILNAAEADVTLQQMGTTLTGIFSYNGCFYLINCGDSRVYRFRDGFLRQLTTDHSERERLGDSTVPSNLIYNAMGRIGAFIDVEAFDNKFPMRGSDRYLICSDGLSDMLSDETIAGVLRNNGTPQDLVDAAIEAGGSDNVTVILLTVFAPDEEKTDEEDNRPPENDSMSTESRLSRLRNRVLK